jgi:hypothetical protein
MLDFCIFFFLMFARFLRSDKISSFWLLFSMREEISELKKAFKNF